MYYCQLVHAKIKELREEKGWTQYELVRQSGAGLRTLQSWNSGNDIEAKDEVVQPIFMSLGKSEEEADALIAELKAKAATAQSDVTESNFTLFNNAEATKSQPVLSDGHKQGSINHYSRKALKVLGRVDEQVKLRRFLKDERPFCWLQLAGEGGQGKTRLAYDLILEARKNGWNAGFMFGPQFKAYSQIWNDWQPDRPTLLVIDYLIGKDGDVGPMFYQLLDRIKELRLPVRLLLLERQRWDRSDRLMGQGQGESNAEQIGTSDWYDALANKNECSAAGIDDAKFEDAIIPLEDLGAELLIEITRDIAEQEGCKLSQSDEFLQEQLAQIDQAGRPLYAYFLGQSLAREPEKTNWSRNDVLQSVLDKDRNSRWKLAFDGQDYDLGTGTQAEKIAVLATMMGEIDCSKLRDEDELFKTTPPIRKQALALVDGGFGVSGASNVIPPLQPDILGEYFVLQSIEQGLDSDELSALAWRIKPYSMAEFLIRLTRDFPKQAGTLEIASFEPDGESISVYVAAASKLMLNFWLGETEPPKVVMNALELAANKKDASLVALLGAASYLGFGVKQSFEKAVILYQEASDLGNAEATCALGAHYFWGKGVPQNHIRAVEFYQKASDMGHASATFNLANSYFNGEGVEQDMVKAVTLYQIASDMGEADATNNLAIRYSKGEGVAQDLTHALALFQQASDMGHAFATYNLAKCYDIGLGVVQDQVHAVELYQKASDMGHADATFGLALCYDKGEGVEQDLAHAVTLYQRAANMGHAGATFNLALSYRKGEGVEQDLAHAVTLYQKASDMGYAQATGKLALCYAEGDGVEQDLDKALELAEKTVEQGHESAEELLEWIKGLKDQS